MTDATNDSAVTHHAGWFAYLRLILALLCTALLPLGWGRLEVVTMQTGRPEGIVLAVFAVVFLVVVLASWNLGHKLSRVQPWRWQRQDTVMLLFLLLVWFGAYALVFGYYVDSLIHPAIVYALFVPSTIWVLAASWSCYWPLPWKLRGAGLMMLLILAVDFPLLMRVEGLTGAGKVNFAWRHTTTSTPMPAEAIVPKQPIPWLPLTEMDFAQYLGAARTAVLTKAHAGADWTQQPPKRMWRRPICAGWSSCAIVNGYVITQEQIDNVEAVTCYRLKDGEVVWRHVDPERFDSSLGGPGPRATPTVAEGRVYTLGATGLLNCLDFGTGQAVWSVNILKDNEGQNIDHGICGSPLETEAGWLVLTHGVGAMRNYCIGATLLDRDDPRRVIGRLREPLLEPLDHERDGYVPNVVYSCGSQIHNGWLVIPYAVSDYATTTACVEIGQLLQWLVDQRT